MKTLLLLRHAKADRDDASLADHERPLTKRGAKAAKRIGELIRGQGLLADLVLSSTATRAKATAEIVIQVCGEKAPLELVPELYLAEPPAYLDALRRLGHDASRVLMVGHNPGLETLIFRLTGEAEHMPTAALAACQLEIASWSELTAEGRATLKGVWRPKELDE